MNEEKLIAKFLSNNPVLNDRIKKLGGQYKLESDIIVDLDCLILFQINFEQYLNKDYAQLQETISNVAKTSNSNTELSVFDKLSPELVFDSQHYPQTKDIIRIERLSNEILKSLFTIVSTFPSAEGIRNFHQAHSLFVEIMRNRNMICSKFRNVFSPLPLFSISQQDSMTKSSSKTINHDFSNLFCQCSPYVYSTFLPTHDSLYQLQQILENHHFDKKKELHFYLNLLIKDLNRTNLELINMKSDYQVSNIWKSDIRQFPPFDVVRESPVYNEFKTSIANIMDHVRSRLLLLQNSMNDLISHAIKTLETSNSIFANLSSIQNELSLSSNQNDEKKNQKRTLIFHDSAIDKEKDAFEPQQLENQIHQYIQFDHGAFVKLDRLKTGDFKEFVTFLQSIKAEYSKYPQLIAFASHQLNSQKDLILQKIPHYETAQSGQTSTQPDFNSLFEKLSQYRNPVEFDNSNLKSNIETLKELNADRPTLIPLFFEDILKENARDASNIEWTHQRFNFHQTENEKKKKAVEQNSLILNGIKSDIEEVKKRIEEKKLSHHNLEDTPPPLSESKSQFICPICKSNIRDAMLFKCGHTFCKRCLVVLCRKGIQRCPECNIFFSESNIKPITW